MLLFLFPFLSLYAFFNVVFQYWMTDAILFDILFITPFVSEIGVRIGYFFRFLHAQESDAYNLN